MKLLSSHIFRAAAVALAIPFIGISATQTVNVNGGTVTYAPGTQTSGTTSQAVFAGSDEYYITSSYTLGASASGGTYGTFVPTVTFIGATPPVTVTTQSADSITVDFTGTISDPGATGWNPPFAGNIPFINSPGVSGTGTFYLNGNLIGTVTDGSGSFLSNPISNPTLTSIPGSTLTYALDYTFDFAAGLPDLASGSSPLPVTGTPEPATVIPAALSLAGFALVAIRRRKQ
jgi:hypothetical protein